MKINLIGEVAIKQRWGMLPPSTPISLSRSLHFAITFIYCISKSFFPCFLFFILAANQKEAATVNMNCALKLTKFRQRIQHSFKPFIHLSIHRFITPLPSLSTHGSQRDFYCAAAPLPVVLMRFQTLFFPSLLNIENKYFHSLGVNWKNRTRNKSHSSPACIFTYFPLVLLLMIRVFS